MIELADKADIDIQRILRAIDLAAIAHAGQFDKAGEPYLWHVLRVGIGLLPDVDAAVLGILHDVREDSDTREEDIQEALGEHHQHLYAFLGTLTHDGKQPYPEYVAECARWPVTRAVKKADLRDNLNIRRLAEAQLRGSNIYALMAKYIPALAVLNDE